MNGLWGASIGLAVVALLYVADELLPTRSDRLLYSFMAVVHGVGGYIVGRLYQHICKLSATDYLTQVYNRSFFVAETGRQLDLAKRHKYPVSLIIIDLDNFKCHNDTHGHLAGDSLLRSIALEIRRHVRQSDTVARFGGDEFVILLPLADGTGGMLLMERIKDILTTRVLSKTTVTLSAGVATYPDDGNTVEELIGRADKALYRAKSKRNRIEHFRAVAQ